MTTPASSIQCDSYGCSLVNTPQPESLLIGKPTESPEPDSGPRRSPRVRVWKNAHQGPPQPTHGRPLAERMAEDAALGTPRLTPSSDGDSEPASEAAEQAPAPPADLTLIHAVIRGHVNVTEQARQPANSKRSGPRTKQVRP
jgi:hypothetical protein